MDLNKIYRYAEKINLMEVEEDKILSEYGHGVKFHYEEIKKDETILPPGVMAAVERVLNYCRMKYRLPKLKIRWIRRTIKRPFDFTFDFPVMGQARSENEILVNPFTEFIQVPRTIAHEAFHAFRMKEGITEREEATAEQVVDDILSEIEELWD